MTDPNPKSQTLIRIVDDDDNLRHSLEFLLRVEDWKCVGYTSAEEFIEKDDLSVPGCLILDVRLDEMSGLELQSFLNRRKSVLPIIFISAHGELDMAVQTMRRGAVDFLSKPLDTQRLLTSLQEAASKDLLFRKVQDERTRLQGKFNNLTLREKEISIMVARGLSNKQIASELNITERTVQTHRTAAFTKLDVHSAMELYRVLEAIDASFSEDFSS